MVTEASKITKNRPKKHKNSSADAGVVKEEGKHASAPSASGGDDTTKSKSSGGKDGGTIEALSEFRRVQKAWPKDMSRLLDPSLPEERRVELWELMCNDGDSVRQRYAWAIPDERALRILKHFSPIVEIGSGLGYWAMLLRSRGVDVKAYDKVAGAPTPSSEASASASSKKRDRNGPKKGVEKAPKKKRPAKAEPEEDEDDGSDEEPPSFWTEVEEGGPEMLEESCNEGRALFLCYPDDFEIDQEKKEEDEEEEGDKDEKEDDEDEEDGELFESLGLRCLRAFEGDVVIHVGEMFGDSVCVTPGQSPWGRTTAQECQEELAAGFHCILKVPLPRWPHARDTLTVWKRHTVATFHYGDSNDEDEDEDSDDEEGETAAAEKAKKGGGGKKASAKEEDKKAAENEGKACGRKAGKAGGCGEKSGSKACRERCGAAEGDESGDDEMRDALISMADIEMFAHVPVDEEMPCAQAAPCVQFLLDDK